MRISSKTNKVPSFEDFLTEEKLNEIVEKFKKIQQQEEEFFKSEKYEEMASSLIAKDYALDGEYFAYNKEEVIAALGWEKFTTEEIELFFSVVTSIKIGVEDKDVITDYCAMFETYYIIKENLLITVMHGQGTAFNIRPYKESELPKILHHITGHSLMECKKALFATNFDVKGADLYLAKGTWRAGKLISFDHDSLNKKAAELKHEYSHFEDHYLMEVLKNCGGNIVRAENMLLYGTPYPSKA